MGSCTSKESNRPRVKQNEFSDLVCKLSDQNGKLNEAHAKSKARVRELEDQLNKKNAELKNLQQYINQQNVITRKQAEENNRLLNFERKENEDISKHSVSLSKEYQQLLQRSSFNDTSLDTLQNLNETNRKLVAENEKLKKKNEEYHKHTINLQKLLQKDHTAVENKYKLISEEKDAAIEKLKSERKQLKHKVLENESHIKDLIHELHETQNEIRKEKHDTLERDTGYPAQDFSENNTMTNDTKYLFLENNEKIVKLQQNVENLRQKLQKKQDTIASQNDHIYNHEKHVQNLNEEIATTKRENMALKSQLENQKLANNSTVNYEHLDKHISIINGQNARIGQLNYELTSLKAENEMLRKTIDDCKSYQESEKDSHKIVVDSMKHRISQLSLQNVNIDEISLVQKENEQLQRKLSESESKLKRSSLTTSYRSTKDLLDKKDKEINKLNLNLNNFEKELTERKEYIKELEHKIAQSESYLKNLEESERNVLRNSLSASYATTKDLEKKDKQIEQLNKNLLKLESALEESKQYTRILEKTNLEHQTKHQSVNYANYQVSSKSRTENVDVDVDYYEKEIKKQEELIQKLRNDARNQSEQIVKLQGQIYDMKAVEKALLEKKEQNRKLNDDIYEKNLEISRKSTEIEILKRRQADRDEKKRLSLERLQSQNINFTNVQLRPRKEEPVLKDPTEDLKKEIESLRSALQEQKAKLVKSGEEIQKLKKDHTVKDSFYKDQLKMQENENEEAWKQQQEQLQREVEALRETLKEKEVALTDTSKIVEKLTQDNIFREKWYKEQLEKKVKKELVENLQKEIDRLAGILTEKEENLVESVKELEELKRNGSFKDNYCKEQLKIKETELRKLCKDVQEKNEAIENMRTEVQTLTIDLQTQFVDNQKVLAQKDEEIQKYQDAIKQLNNILQSNNKELEEFRKNEAKNYNFQHVIELKKNIEKLENQLVQKELEIQTFLSSESARTELACDESEESNENFQETDKIIIDAIRVINAVKVDCKKIELEVQDFSGSVKDKTYLKLEELLIRNLTKLDDVECYSFNSLRNERKKQLQCIQNILEDLKNRATE